jgi:hypothetical protein
MKRVFVVGIVHDEIGLANVSELHAILEHIRPDVIFLEIPPAAFDDFVGGRRWNLESSAARQYRDLHRVELIPVDLPTPDEEFFRDVRYLNDTIKRTSSVCSRLFYRDSQYIRAHGFAYLNSEHCSTLWSDLYAAMLAKIRELDDHRLLEIYETWRHNSELRDKAMMKCVEDYSTQSPFDTGVLLVGAAHRQSMIDKARTGYGDGMPTVRWGFDGLLERSHEDRST